MGPVSTTLTVRRKEWNETQRGWVGTAALTYVVGALKDRIYDLGATWGVGLELTVEITEEGNFEWKAVTTAAILEPLFSDSIPPGDDW